MCVYIDREGWPRVNPNDDGGRERRRLSAAKLTLRNTESGELESEFYNKSDPHLYIQANRVYPSLRYRVKGALQLLSKRHR